MKRFAIMVSFHIMETQQSWLAWLFILCLYLHLQFLGCQELTPQTTNTTMTSFHKQDMDNVTTVDNGTGYSEKVTSTSGLEPETEEDVEKQSTLAEEKLPDYPHDAKSLLGCQNSTMNNSRDFLALSFLCLKYFSDLGDGAIERCSTEENLCIFKTEFNISNRDMEIIRHVPLKSFHLRNFTDAIRQRKHSQHPPDAESTTQSKSSSHLPEPPATNIPMHLENNSSTINASHSLKDILEEGINQKATAIKHDGNSSKLDDNPPKPDGNTSEPYGNSYNNSSRVDEAVGTVMANDSLANETSSDISHSVSITAEPDDTGLQNDGLERLNVYKIFKEWSKTHQKKGGRGENDVLDETRVLPYEDHEHKAELHGKTKIDESQLAGFQWKSEHYMMNVLVPIGVGISGALLIVSLFYLLRTCSKDSAATRNAQRRPSRNTGRMEVQMPQETATTDHVMLLADSSSDEF